MKLFWLFVLILALFAGVPTGLYFFDIHPAVLLNEYPQYAVLGLFGFPFVVAIVIVVLMLVDRGSYRYSAEYLERSDQPAGIDMMEHAAVGLVLVLLQDISRGQILQQSLYAPELAFALQQELRQLAPYLQRGYRFHFDFRAGDGYKAYPVRTVHAHEILMEVEGRFDYYVERNGEMHLTPHEFDRAEPLMRVPGVVRLRMRKNGVSDGSESWTLLGFSENIRGLALGASVE